jgi:fructuronate reductase
MRASNRRLCEATLSSIARGIETFPYRRAQLGVGIVHFGPGAFHRVHQAHYVDRLLAHDARWGICAVSLMHRALADALKPQDCLYTLTTLEREWHTRVVGALVECLFAPNHAESVRARLAAAQTEAVTLTVTEKGYCLGADGALDLRHPDIRHDLAAPNAPRAAVGWIVEGLRLRHASRLPPFTVLSCDNLPDNGATLRRAVIALAYAQDPELARWIERTARFPNTMVDGITPAGDDALTAHVAAVTGLVDTWPVQREPFVQWVIEDASDGTGPDWARAGAIVTPNVAPYARAKLRLLNAAHSSLAYLGSLHGCTTVAEAMAVPTLAAFVRALTLDDVAPLLRNEVSFDIQAYVLAILERLRNPAIRHLLSQIAWDGSQKLPIRLLATIADCRDAGRPVSRLCLSVAGWMRYVVTRTRQGQSLVDPLADRLADVARSCRDEARLDVPRFLALSEIFPSALSRDPQFREAITSAYDSLAKRGVTDSVQDAMQP